MVEAEAAKMAEAAIGEGKKGQLATVRYLFEMASIFPAPTDGGQATNEEDCLAQTLLRRLNLPEVPIARDEEDDVVKVADTGDKADRDLGNEPSKAESSSADSEADSGDSVVS